MNDFESLSHEKKYWFLGLFCTDGHFNGKNTVLFNQQRCDRDLLEKTYYMLGIPEDRLEDNENDEGQYTRLRIIVPLLKKYWNSTDG